MTEQQQRIAIAKAFPDVVKQSSSGSWMWKSSDGRWHWCPDNCVLSDLNAMHEVEKLLTPRQWVSYGKHVQMLCEETITWRIHATAAQRAEAFLRTLNLWKP